MSRHLAIFLPSLGAGGAEKVILSLAERFVARGIRCDLVIAIDSGRWLDRVPAGVCLVRLHKQKALSAVFALARYLRRERPDALLSTIFSANIAALIAAALSRVGRIVIREANHVEIDVRAETKAQTWMNRIAAGWLYPRADVVIAVAESVREGLLRIHLVPESRIRVIRNPVSLVSLSKGTQPHVRDGSTVLACGRLEPQKDHATLLRAFAALRSRLGAKLVVLGEGSLLQTLQTQAINLGIHNDVAFVGFDPDPEQWMRSASVFAHTALYEGFSNVLLEALAAGCPVVAVDDSTGGVREVLADGKYGTLVPVGDDRAVASAIEQVLTKKVQFPDVREYLHQFDVDRVADAYLSALFPTGHER